ncbi:MAG: type II toxin-antitoxin system RelE/ParE family toxin [Candidatus Marinimicrobia bacterium]|nr:type II toxin-antitoxin system RelE/ParE family toxin [Candidatus Neomarinimicrobiota bacterium]
MSKFRLAETQTFLKHIESPAFRGYYEKIKTAIYPILAEHPHYGPNIKRLKGQLKGIYRYRIGNYRLFYTIDENERRVFILDFSHRKDAYR